MQLTKNQKINCLTFLLAMMLQPNSLYANWTGPAGKVVGEWGSSPGQFYYEAGETVDDYPREFGVDKDGFIVIADESNKRIQIFNPDGTLKKIITPLSQLPVSDALLGWPSRLKVATDGNSILIDCFSVKASLGYKNTKKCILDYDGTLKATIDIGQVYVGLQGYILQRGSSYFFYSASGQLLRTSASRPIDFGDVKTTKLRENQYKITITYPDVIFGLLSDREFSKYVRDVNGKVYGVNAGGVWRFNICGKLEGQVLMPENQIELVPSGVGGEPIPSVDAEYGKPVVAPSGDVYAWQYTPDTYSILKWTWVDDPNVPTGPDAPTNLTLTPSINGLYLTWKASPNDPGCVTKYEIARATTSGGVFSTIDTVEKGVLKYNDTTAEVGTTYYYKVRAMAGSDPSAYTAEVSGKR